MAELKEITEGKVYVLAYDRDIVDCDNLYEEMREIYTALPKGSKLLALPNYCTLQEESTEDLLELKAMIESILESRQNNS